MNDAVIVDCVRTAVGKAGRGALKNTRPDDLAAIAIFTESGNTVRLLSKYRPDAPIYALSPDPNVVHRLMLLWGTTPTVTRPITYP